LRNGLEDVVRNWAYHIISGVAFLMAFLVGWNAGPISQKIWVLPLCLAAVIGARFFFAARLSFTNFLFARASIWIMLFVLITAAMMELFKLDLPKAGSAAVLFSGVMGIFFASLMIFSAISKPCPMCDAQSPIQFIKGPTLWGGTDGFRLSFWQSGVSSRCPHCDTDWSFTEAEIREARAHKQR
jgi:hypothetical protein